jgi:trimethylamine:corrinoid methyltransferase-like protein
VHTATNEILRFAQDDVKPYAHTGMEPIRILTSSQMEQIDAAAQSILERTGVKVDSPEALDYLKRFGCRVDEATRRVNIPRQLSRQVSATSTASA